MLGEKEKKFDICLWKKQKSSQKYKNKKKGEHL